MVTMTIHGNEAYCYEMGWVLNHLRICECEGCRECKWCGGSGEYTYTEFPFVLRFTRATFDGVWTALGLDSSTTSGQVWGNRLLRAIHKLEPASVRQAFKEYAQDSKRRPNRSARGETHGRDDLTYLAYMAIEAMHREELVTWSEDAGSGGVAGV